MSQSVRCGNCGEPIADQPHGLGAPQRKPCPKCGSTSRAYGVETQMTISPSVKAETFVSTYPKRLLALAGKLISDGLFELAVVVACVACEIAVARSLSEAFAAKGIPYLEDPVTEFFSGYSLANDRIRKLYTALTEDAVEKTAFWPEFKKLVNRRNDILHSGITVTKTEAEESYSAAEKLIAHLKK